MSKLRLRATPTKSALLALRKQVNFLHEGHELLERKRELLTKLVYEHIGEYREKKALADATLKHAYHWLGIAQLRIGNRALMQTTLGASPSVKLNVLPRRALGVQYPSVTAEILPPMPIGLLGTDPSFDEARKAFAEASVRLAQLAEVEMALYRLMSEQRKAQKRVNALKYNIIPTYEQAIHRINDALEEEERSTLFQIKRLAEKQSR